MKKILFLTIVVAGSFGANAQYVQSMHVNTPAQTGPAIASGDQRPMLTMPNKSSMPGARTTATMDRWYSYSDIINQLLFNSMYNYAPPTLTAPQETSMWIWFDSTVTQRFFDGTTTSYGKVNFTSVAGTIYPPYVNFQDVVNVLQPFYDNANGAATPNLDQLMAITDTNAYQVDSVWFEGAYSRIKPSRHTADSVIISIVPSNKVINYTSSTDAWVSHYTATGKLNAYVPNIADSIRHAAGDPNAANAGVRWAVALFPDTDGDSVIAGTGGYYFRRRVFGVPGGGHVNIPAGYSVSVSITFKSTATWVPNVDSVEGFNTYRPMFGYENSSSYMTNWPEQYASDHNGSSIMFSTFGHYTRYDPTIEIEGFNNRKPLFYNYLWCGAHMICNTCKTIANTHTGVGVKNVSGTISTVSAYPNPANDKVAISFNLPNASNVNVTLNNTIGQVIANQTLNNTISGKAEFNTSALPAGVYFYSIEANGQRSVGHVVVAH